MTSPTSADFVYHAVGNGWREGQPILPLRELWLHHPTAEVPEFHGHVHWVSIDWDLNEVTRLAHKWGRRRVLVIDPTDLEFICVGGYIGEVRRRHPFVKQVPARSIVDVLTVPLQGDPEPTRPAGARRDPAAKALEGLHELIGRNLERRAAQRAAAAGLGNSSSVRLGHR